MNSALTDLESATQFRGRHVWRKRWVTQKIDAAEHIDDTARPRSRLSGSEGARPLPAQRGGHCARQVPIFGIQVPVANAVDQADNLFVHTHHCFWNRVQPSRSCHRGSLPLWRMWFTGSRGDWHGEIRFSDVLASSVSSPDASDNRQRLRRAAWSAAHGGE